MRWRTWTAHRLRTARRLGCAAAALLPRCGAAPAGADTPAVSVVVEDRVADDCLADSGRIGPDATALLQDFGIPVDPEAAISVIVQVLGHATRKSRHPSARRCAGMVTVRVSSLALSADRGPVAESLYSRERLLVDRAGLDRVLFNNARELLDQFSRRHRRR